MFSVELNLPVLSKCLSLKINISRAEAIQQPEANTVLSSKTGLNSPISNRPNWRNELVCSRAGLSLRGTSALHKRKMSQPLNLTFSSLLLVPDNILQENITVWLRKMCYWFTFFLCFGLLNDNTCFWGCLVRAAPNLLVTAPWSGGAYRCQTQVHSVSTAGLLSRLLSQLPDRRFLKLLDNTQQTKRKTEITRNKDMLGKYKAKDGLEQRGDDGLPLIDASKKA